MITLNIIRNCIVAVFYILLIGTIVHSIKNLLSQRTTFEEKTMHEGAFLPSVTLCKYSWQKDNLTSFEDVQNAIDETKAKYEANLFWGQVFRGSSFDNLKDPVILEQKFNVTLEDVWQFSPRIEIVEPYTMSICVTLNPPMGELTTDLLVKVCYVLINFGELLGNILVDH